MPNRAYTYSGENGFSDMSLTQSIVSLLSGGYYAYIAGKKPILLRGRLRGIEGIIGGSVLAYSYYKSKSYFNDNQIAEGHKLFLLSSVAFVGSYALMYRRQKSIILLLLGGNTLLESYYHGMHYKTVLDRGKSLTTRTAALNERLDKHRERIRAKILSELSEYDMINLNMKYAKKSHELSAEVNTKNGNETVNSQQIGYTPLVEASRPFWEGVDLSGIREVDQEWRSDVLKLIEDQRKIQIEEQEDI